MWCHSLHGRGWRSQISLALGGLASLSLHPGAYYKDRGWDDPCWPIDVEDGKAFQPGAWASRGCISHTIEGQEEIAPKS